METAPIVRVVTSSLFEENAYLVSLTKDGDCIVVDPGLDADQIVEALQAAGLNPVAILNTHGHGDHIAGNELLKQTWPDAPLIIGEGDAWKLTDPAGKPCHLKIFRATVDDSLSGAPGTVTTPNGSELLVARH